MALPLAVSLACADDRLARSDGAAPGGPAENPPIPPAGDAPLDLGLSGADEPGPDPALGDDATLDQDAPSGVGDGELPPEPDTETPDAGDAAPDAGAGPDAGAAAPDGGGTGCTPDLPRRVVVQWSNVQRFSRDVPNTFQLVLFETGDFAYLYRRVDVASDVPTIGYQGTAGDRAFSLDVAPDDFAAGRVVYFRANAQGVPVVDANAELSWFDASIGGAPLSLLDEQTQPVTLPFAFPFLGGTYSEARVSSNGFVGLSSPFAEYANTDLPNADWGAMLAVFWDDLDPAEAGRVVYQALDDCAVDCQGEQGGLARIDRCGVCAGGKTGIAPDANVDCAGACFGDAVVDACGTCGGTSSDAASCGPKPDLVVDADYMAETIAEDFVDVASDACLFNEGCVTGTGLRRVVRFGTRIANVGTSDLVIGAPESENPLWEFDACHGHFHFESHAQYDLIEAATSLILPIGVKNGFCLRDNEVWDAALATTACDQYDCESQGISAGCADVYDAALDCQWIDITDVSPGDYTLRVTTNPNARIPELDYVNNSATVRIRITDDDVALLPED